MYFVEKTRSVNITKRFDYILFSLVLVLSVIGLFVLSSATYKMTGGSSIMKTQYISFGLGVILALIISFVDYKDFKILGALFFIISIALLILVLLIGTGEQLGSKSWLRILGYKFQPSELGKIVFIIIAAMFLERIKEGTDRMKNIAKLLVYSGIPIGLIMLQPDFGTAVVFMFIFSIMVFMCDFPYRYILTAAGIALASAPLLWLFVLKDYQKKRILVFLSPESDPKGAGFNVIRAKTAIGSGKLFGKHLYEGIQTQNNGVPVKESDFIFTVIGEELGFIGAIAVILLMLLILMRCLYIARNSRDGYGAFLVVGVVGLLSFHFIQNIGMCIGLLPVTGIPLPFISSGGSAMISNYAAVGIVLSVSVRRKKAIFNSEE